MSTNYTETAENEVYIFPTSYAQQRLWFLDQFEPGSPFYNIPLAVKIHGQLDIAALEKTLEEIVFRHESLRTTFDTENGDPVQVIHPEMQIPLKTIDLTHLDDTEKDQESFRLATNEARTPFDLKTGPLFRATLIKTTSNEFMMLITMHHIISDGWSMGVFMREVSILYRAFSQKQPFSLPELPIQYADFSSWQRNWLQGEVLDKQLNYWQEKLGHNPPVLELPTDKPRPAVQSSRGASYDIIIPAEVNQQMIKLSRQEGITPFMAYLTVFYVLLYRYSGQDDICIGTPIANRTQGETEGLIGFFVNTLVLRSDLSGNPKFKELAQRIRKMTLEAYAHQDLPFEMLVEAVQPERSMSHSPLFQVMFIMQNVSHGGSQHESNNGSSNGQLKMEQITVDTGTSTFDMTISLSEEGDGSMSASIEFCSDLFEKETAARFLAQYSFLLEQFSNNPDQTITDAEILTEFDKKTILQDWNATDARYDYKKCMHTLVEENAVQTPSALAVAFSGKYLTYEELNIQSNKLAHFLIRKGVKPETPVGISLEKSLDLIIAVLAVLKAGGGYVPMDPDYPEDRLEHMIVDSGTPVLITNEYLLNKLPLHNAFAICLDRDKNKIQAENAENPQSAVIAENMAYMIYTSGTTGKAKGTVVTHQSWVNSYYAWEDAYELKTRCRSHLQMANFSFDVFAGDTIRALGSGGKLTLIPREVLLSAEQLYEQIISEKISIAEFVPAVLRNLTAYLDENSQDLSFMRCLIAGSDAWYVGEYKKYLKYGGPETRLINSFGLTEASIDTTYFEASSIDLPADRLVPIGKPFPNMTVYILDENLRPTPIGVPGEICVGGAGVARGYYNRSDLTAEKFIPDPFSVSSGSRLYRTGDRARFLNDGNVEFLGRIDYQVKLRGFRIELGEIESNLGKHQQVKQNAVIVREDEPGDKRLVAYYVASGKTEPDRSELRRFLLESLPDYMVPNAFIAIERIPLTPNGKVDRKALPKPDQSAFGSEEEYIAPRNEDEEKIASIWANVLKLDKVGVYNNFFDLGGHSLLATQLVSRIREAFDLDIPLRNIFEFPTVAALAEQIEIMRKSGQAGVQAPPIMAVSRQQELPLSFSQKRLWFLDQLEPGTANYNIPEAARLKGELKAEIIEKALNEIIKRHEILRTNFIDDKGSPKLIIHKERKISLEYFDLLNITPNEREKQSLKIAGQFARTVFNLEKGPLFRVGLIKMDSDDHIFLFTIHHIISDDWSSQVMIGELSILYSAFEQNEKSPLPALPVQYADFAHWQQNWLSGEVLDSQLSYWKDKLSGSAPLLELPTDRPRPKMQTINGDYITFEFPEQLVENFKKFTQQSGLTSFMALMAVFQTILYRYTGQENFNIGTPVANRNRAETEPLIGFFVNTLVINSNISGHLTFMELLKRVRETSLEAYAHQDIPFEKIVDALQPVRDTSHSPLFQVMFVLQSAANQPEASSQENAPIKVEPVEAHSGTAKFDLTLFMVEDHKELSGAIEFNSDLFDRKTIERFIKHIQNILVRVIQNPEIPIGQIDYLEQHEKIYLIEKLNQFKNYKIQNNFKELFESNAQKYSNLTAVLSSENNFTYDELNKLSNKFAHYLIYLGVKREELVAVSAPRSFELIAAIIGIIKAGAAYVPIDASYPEERINYIIKDSETRFLVSHSKQEIARKTDNIKVIDTDKFENLLSDFPDINLNVKINNHSLVYMIYTSGSTGKPKGTMITHAGLIHYLNWTLEKYPLTSGSGSLLHSTIAFDATVTALYTPLISGKSITIADSENDLDALSKSLVKYENFSVVKITPAHLDLLSQQIPAERAQNLTKAFIIGGENLTSDQISFWKKYAPETDLYNEYGPTETVVGCVVYNAKEWNGRGSVPIGKAIPNSPVYILDKNLQAVPKGVPGELYISGNGVARGYYNRPSLTAERFIPDPFSDNPGTRMYKTGDLVRYMNDDQMVFLNRIDSQVKIRGYRIELGEIENAILEIESINEAAVIVREDIVNEKRLVGYYAGSIESEAIKSILGGFLPEYMIPSVFVKLESLPLTENGKVDRKNLPKPEFSREELKIEYIEPRNQTEKELAEIWQKVLHIEKIGINDNFFELGGHSLLATQLVSRVRDNFETELPVMSLFEYPTIAELAIRIEQLKYDTVVFKKPPLQKYSKDELIPLSFAQQRLWFLDQLSPGNANYNIPSAFKISGPLKEDVLEQALLKVIERHEVLRTCYVNRDGKAFGQIIDDINFTLQKVDLSNLGVVKAEQKAKQIADQDAARPFDLEQAPLFRLQLIKLSENEHLVVLNMHHIISDGWSTGVMLSEISLFYDALSRKVKPLIEDQEIQYSDYAVWQRSWLKDDVLEAQMNFWEDKLGYNPPLIELPLDFNRPPVQTFNGDVISTQISEKLSQRIQKLTKDNGVTLFMTLLTAWQTLLYRYSGQDEIFIGSPIANRNMSEIENLIGFFVNTLVLKAEFDREITFESLIRQIKQFTLAAYSHQDVPFEQLVDTLQTERSMSHSPLFQVMFVLQNAPLSASELPEITIEPIAPETKTAKFDLTLVALENPSGFFFELEYNTDLFREETANRILKHFELILDALCEKPDKPVSQLLLLSPDEYTQITNQWNDTHEVLPEPTIINRLFEETVKNHGKKEALVFNNITLSFDELNEKANRLAHLLISKGIKPETAVGISVERSPEMVIGLLAILKSGGIYLPIDSGYPQDRIEYIIEDAGIDYILTQKKFTDIFEKKINNAIYFEDLDDLRNFDSANPNVQLFPENAAYMIYTSGSTGRPKGTVISHKSLCNLTLFQIKDFKLDQDSRCLQFASFSFDASVSEIFTTLISGATLVLGKKEQLLPGPELVQLFKQEKITTVTLPPSVSSVLREETLPDLRVLVSAGETLPIELANHWSKNRRLLNAYGPTENAVCASSFIIPQNYTGPSIPIGKPIDNVRLYILDENLNILPVGVAGELHIAGTSLARGYFNRPDLTAERFIPDLFTKEPGSRLYKSGDKARFLKDGNIEFLGRIDDQVKLRGFRIELDEIRSVISTYPDLDDAFVLVQQSSGNEILTAYYTSQKPITADELQQFLARKLPGYMIPAAYIRLEKFPLTINGKIDKRALPAPKIDRNQLENQYIAARNEQEKTLTAIFHELLDVDQIGIHDNFFRLGGHSLLATQLISRINKIFKVNLPLQVVFEQSTIAGLSTILSDPALSVIAKKPAITKADHSKNIPLSFAQQRLWFLDQLSPDDATYNLPAAVKITGPLNPTMLKESINLIAKKHEILRTTFDMVKGKANQIIHEKPQIEFNIITLESIEEKEREREAFNIITTDTLKAFDLQNGPLTRVNVVKVSNDLHYFGMTMHHIISDGWSMGILINEMMQNYSEIQLGKQPSIKELEIQYGDFAVWQREWLKDDVLDNEFDYWKKRLSGAPPLLNLPLDRPRPAIQNNHGNTISFDFSKELLDKLKKYCHQQDTTVFMTLFAAFNVLLNRYSGQDDITVGTPIANRNQAETEELIGFFVNTLVLRTDLSDNPDFNTLIQRVKKDTIEAYQHQDIPFEMLVDQLAPDREMSHTPLFQVMFVLQNTPVNSAAAINDLSIEPIEADANLAKFDITATLIETESGLSGSFEYKTDLFDQSTIDRMIKHYENILAGLLSEPAMPVSRIPVMDKKEKQQVLASAVRERSVFPVTKCIHRVFEENAQKFGERTALSFENKNISYDDLNKKANQLARYLNNNGIKTGDLVGLCVDRSAEMVIAIIAILKAGAAYVSLDPAYPEERLNNIIENAQMPLILVQSHVEDKLPAHQAKVINLDQEYKKIQQLTDTNPNYTIDPGNMAYIIYTSGSTGKPKGVMVNHDNVVRLFDATQHWYEFNEKDVWTYFHSYAFDFSVWELWGALFYGGRVVVVPYLTTRSPEDFYNLVKKEKVTVLNQTPSAFRQFIQVDEETASSNEMALRYVIFGGDTLELQSLKPWFNKYGDKKPQLINMYGITETTVHVTYRPISLEDLKTAPGSVIGEAIPDLQVYVLDNELQPVPFGVPGELYVGGAGVARGYHKQADLTVERFIPDPFSKNPDARLYRTGDLARRLANNDLEYLGRIDHQVQIRGFRVELGEIESILGQFPDIKETVVLLREDSPGDKRLVAYVVASDKEKVSISEMRRFMQQQLPDYMVPSAIVVLDQFPLTAHGKIDRKVLPIPKIERSDLETKYIAPRNEKEKILAEIWSQILGVGNIGVFDNFFELGGDSILMIQVIARAKEHNIYFSPAQVFQNPTISTLAEVSKNAAQIEQEQGIISGDVQLTSIQHWFFDHHSNYPKQFNVSMMFELFQPADKALLEKTFKLLFDHHDALRSSFIFEKGKWKLTIKESFKTIPVQWTDLSKISRIKQKGEIEKEAALAQSQIELEKAPLARFVYFDLGKKKNHRLLLVFHHLVLDGVSWRIIIEDFVQIYSSLLQKKKIKLPEKSTSYKRWSEKINEYALSDSIKNELEYWLRFQNRSSLLLPYDKKNGSNTYGLTKDITLSFGIENTQKLLQKVPSILKTSINDVLLTALIRSLSQSATDNKLLLEMEGHGREDIIDGIDLSRTVGWFTTIFPVYLDISSETEIKDQILSVNRQLNQIPNNGIGFNILKYLSSEDNSSKIKALPQPKINFNYLGQFDQAARGSGNVPFRMAPENPGPEQHPDENRSCDLYLVAVVNGQELHTRWLYSTEMFNKSTVKQLGQKYLKELEVIINSVITGE